jgi:hypothetical protein
MAPKNQIFNMALTPSLARRLLIDVPLAGTVVFLYVFLRVGDK